jgi:hypothetical protein
VFQLYHRSGVAIAHLFAKPCKLFVKNIHINQHDRIMKTHPLLTLILLLFVGVAILPPEAGQAESTPAGNASNCIGEVPSYISPANLAMMAYQGYLEKQGIPGYQVLATQWSFGKITATQIVEAAVKGCLLSNKYGVATHKNYVQDLAMQVQILIEENR